MRSLERYVPPYLPVSELEYPTYESQQSDVAFAIISSYSTDYEFAYKMFSPATPVVIVSHPATESRESSVRFIQQNWIRITPKLLYHYSCMHMKVCSEVLQFTTPV